MAIITTRPAMERKQRTALSQYFLIMGFNGHAIDSKKGPADNLSKLAGIAVGVAPKEKRADVRELLTALRLL